MTRSRTRRAPRLLACLVLVLGLAVGELSLAAFAGAAPASPAASGVVAKRGPGAQERAQKRARRQAQRAARAQQVAATRRAALARERAWTPRDSTYFNYPEAKRAADRFRIRNVILAAIKATPGGASIRASTFTFVDTSISSALIAAHRRGVSVQVVVNRKESRKSRSFRTLARALNRRPRGTVVNPGTSFVSTCSGSCRGSGGNQHTKLYLFSQVGHAGFVSMVASANLTRFAAVGQWNHLDVSLGRDTYTRLLGVFDQMTLDTPSPFTTFVTKKLQAWVFPRPGTTPANDPVVASLRRISCIGPAPRTSPARAKRLKRQAQRIRQLPPRKRVRAQAQERARAAVRARAVAAQRARQRTAVRISMYAWHDARGTALARLVRQRADQGCDVAVIYSFVSPQVLRILRSKAGRGPIPMRRSITTRGGKPADYSHSKYVAVNGTWNNHRSQQVWTGSMNFTPLGTVSDDIVVRIPGARTYASYLANFQRVWTSRTSKRPGA